MVNKFKLSNKLLFVVKQLRFMKSAKLLKELYWIKGLEKSSLLEQMCFGQGHKNTMILPSGEARLQWMVGEL